MYHPTRKEFLKLSKRGNVIPVYKQINADLDTPVSAFLKLGEAEHSFLLESVEGQEKIARYSFLGARPSLVFKSKGRNIQIDYPGRGQTRRFVCRRDPLDEIRKIMQGFRPVTVKGLPRFYGGFVGYIGYDAVRFFERIPDKNPDDLKVPDAVFILTDTILVFDHVNHTIKLVANAMLSPWEKGPVSRRAKEKAYAEAVRKIASLEARFSKGLAYAGAADAEPLPAAGKRGAGTSNLTKPEFCAMVRKAKQYIRAGEIIQAVLSQRFRLAVHSRPFDVYRRLRSLNPSPYMFFLKFKEAVLIGASPEMLVRCEDGVVRTRPIAGTRPRGRDEEEDKRLEKELAADVKEKAEHVMLVDLGRNDLGRVCRPGTVRVNEFMSVERYSHVMHLVTEVRGDLDRRRDAFDLLRASFPAGTVTGSPKIRAMEIIDELENLRRSTYAGCVGYFSFSHNMDTCITIRTILIKDGAAYIQAGAGIVADSVPEKEYAESVNKAKALFEAVAQ